MSLEIGMGIGIPLRGGSSYLQQDEFTTNESAPAASPRNGEPGPDSLVLIQTGNNISVASGNLVFPGHATGANCGAYGSTPRARRAGQSYLFEVTLETLDGFGHVGLVNSAAIAIPTNFTETGAFDFLGIFTPGAIQRHTASGNRVQIGTFEAGVAYRLAIITRDAGGFFLIKGGNYTDWHILKIEFTGEEDDLRVGISNYASAFGVDSLQVGFIRVPARTWVPEPLVSDSMTGATSDGAAVEEPGGSGLVPTDVHGSTYLSSGNLLGTLGTSPAYAIRTYESGESDVLVGAFVTCQTDTGVSLALRVTDKDNCWIVRLNNASNTLEIVERNAGIETIRATADELAIGSAEFVLTAYAKGQTITAYTDHGIRCEYTSAALNETETSHGVLFEGETAVVRSFFVFPVSPNIPAYFND